MAHWLPQDSQGFGSNAGFAPAFQPWHPQPPAIPSSTQPQQPLGLDIVQQPVQAKATPQTLNAKTQSPVDPPPFVQLTNASSLDIQSPDLTCLAILAPAESNASSDDEKRVASFLSGTQVSSLHRLKNVDNKDGGWFCFPGLHIKEAGKYVLHFVLLQKKHFETHSIEEIGEEWVVIAESYSQVFNVYSSKTFPGMQESTFLTRSFSDQGVKVRLRKDSRAQATRKRNHDFGRRLDQKRVDSTSKPVDEHERYIKKQRSVSSMQSPTEQPSSSIIPQASYGPYAPTVQSLGSLTPLEPQRHMAQPGAFQGSSIWDHSPVSQSPQVSAYPPHAPQPAHTPPASEFTFNSQIPFQSNPEPSQGLPSIANFGSGSPGEDPSPRPHNYMQLPHHNHYHTPASSAAGMDVPGNYTTSPIQHTPTIMQYDHQAVYTSPTHHFPNGIMTPLTGGSLMDQSYLTSGHGDNHNGAQAKQEHY